MLIVMHVYRFYDIFWTRDWRVDVKLVYSEPGRPLDSVFRGIRKDPLAGFSPHQRTVQECGVTKTVYQRTTYNDHLNSKQHRGAETREARMDWFLGAPLPQSGTHRGQGMGKVSLRGHRYFPPNDKDRHGGMPNPLSKKRVKEFWGSEIELFHLKVKYRLLLQHSITVMTDKKKGNSLKLPVIWIESCTTAVAEYQGWLKISMAPPASGYNSDFLTKLISQHRDRRITALFQPPRSRGQWPLAQSF